MKIRKGFVTNSSSSSFILAMRDDCTVDDVKGAIEGILLQALKEDEYLLEDAYYAIEKTDKSKSLEDNFNIILEYFVKSLFDRKKYYRGLEIDRWTITADDVSSDGGVMDMFLYSYGHMFEDNDKIKGGTSS